MKKIAYRDRFTASLGACCLPTFCSHDYQSIAIAGKKRHRLIYAVLHAILNKIIAKMKNPDRKTVSQLEELPNIGKAIAGDLRLIGIQHPQDLIGRSPYDLFDKLCNKTGEKHDPCVLDVFLAVVDFMNGGKAKPWWKFTAERKKNR